MMTSLLRLAFIVFLILHPALAHIEPHPPPHPSQPPLPPPQEQNSPYIPPWKPFPPPKQLDPPPLQQNLPPPQPLPPPHEQNSPPQPYIPPWKPFPPPKQLDPPPQPHLPPQQQNPPPQKQEPPPQQQSPPPQQQEPPPQPQSPPPQQQEPPPQPQGPPPQPQEPPPMQQEPPPQQPSVPQMQQEPPPQQPSIPPQEPFPPATQQEPPPTQQEPAPPPQDQKPPPQDQKPPPDQPPPCPFNSRYQGYFQALYAFGDSYTDTGNAQFMGNLDKTFSGSLSSPYGSTSFGKASNRLCDGRLILDFVAEALGLPTVPPYQSTTSNFSNGANFAVAGCTSLENNLWTKIARHFLWKGKLLGVLTQIDWYQKLLKSKVCAGLEPTACIARLRYALFWVGEVGINDYARSVGSTLSLPNIAHSSVLHTMSIVRALIQSGAKNIVVQGLPPVGCQPMDISLCPLKLLDKIGCATIVNGAILLHNQILKHKLDLYRRLFPGANLIYADYWRAYMDIINNPQKYQIQEIHKACCGATGQPGNLNFNIQSMCGASGTSVCSDPSKYVNWDGIHPTEAMNLHVTDLLLNQGYCEPPFTDLFKSVVVE